MRQTLAAKALSRFTGKTALVTGGCGFIGSHLVELLVRNNVECAVVDNLFQRSFRNIEHLGNTFRFYDCDITDAIRLNDVFEIERPTLVFHLAAHHFIPYCDAHPTDAVRTNCLGTQCVVDACRRFEVDRLFYASTAAVYGVSDASHSEADAPDPLDIYGVTKANGERLVTLLARRTPTMVSIGRYFNAVGPHETNPHIVPEIRRQFLDGVGVRVLRLGNLPPMRDYIHVQDLAEGTVVITCADRPQQVDTVNIGTGVESSVRDLVEMFAEELGTPFRIVQDPARTRKVERLHLRANAEKARSQYGWQALRTLRQAVREVLAEAGAFAGQHEINSPLSLAI